MSTSSFQELDTKSFYFSFKPSDYRDLYSDSRLNFTTSVLGSEWAYPFKNLDINQDT